MCAQDTHDIGSGNIVSNIGNSIQLCRRCSCVVPGPGSMSRVMRASSDGFLCSMPGGSNQEPDQTARNDRSCEPAVFVTLLPAGSPGNNRTKHGTAAALCPTYSSYPSNLARFEDASVRLGHKRLRTLLKRPSLWYLPGASSRARAEP